MIKNSLKLSEGNTVEEKIASITIALQLFDTNFKSNRELSHKYITQIAKNVGPQFIKQLVLNSERLRDVAIKFLYILLDLPDVLSEFTSLLQPIISNTLNTTTTQKSSSQSNSVEIIKKLIELSNLSILKSTFHTLLSIASTNTQHPQTLVDLLCECCLYIQYHSETTITHTTATSTNSIITLTSTECASLRSLFIQSLHGALPSDSRNTVYKHLSDLLQTHHTVICTTWTVEVENNKNKGQFARLICSLIHGELQLYIEEFIDIYTHISSSSPVSDPGPSTGTAQHASVADGPSLSQMIIRSEIVYDMLQVFISFLETILSLLLDRQDNGGQNYDPSEENAGVWGVLGESVLSKVQHMAYASISELFDLFKWASEKYDTFAGLIEEGRSQATSLPLLPTPLLPQQQQQDSSSDQGGAAISPEIDTALSPSQALHRQRQVQVNDRLYTILKAAGRVVCGWVMEDESLSAQFLAHVSYMLPFSTTHPKHPHSFDGKEAVSLESPSTTTIAAATAVEVATKGGGEVVGGVVRSWRENDDMLVYIVPCLGALLEGQQQPQQTDNTDTNSRDSDDGSEDDDERGRVIGEAGILEKLCNIPHLITCLLHALSTLPLPPQPPLPSTQFSSSTLQQLLIYEGTCEILTTLLIYKQRELKVLCISEGASASFTSVYGYTVSAELITHTLSVLNKLVEEDENSGLGQCGQERAKVCASVLSNIVYSLADIIGT